MTKHIHIYLGTSTKDDVKHAPAGTSAGGQFTSGGGGGGSTPKHSPMRQANRNLEATQLKESRKIDKQGTQVGARPSIRQMQAKSDVEEAKKRINTKKQEKPASGNEGSHLKAGSEVYSNHGAAPRKATIVGPDPDSKGHMLIKTGNSTLSVPKSNLHPTRQAASK